jgi:predicted permease
MSVVLLAGAGLFVRSLLNVHDVDLGYDVARTLAITPSFVTPGSREAQVAAVLPRVADRLRKLPGVEAVAVGEVYPMGGYSFMNVALPGRDSLPPLGEETVPATVGVGPGYFGASGVRLLHGRDFDARDRGLTNVVVSDAVAKLYWPGRSAVGQCLLVGKDRGCSTVVGVVEDVHRMRVIEEPTLQIYRVAVANDSASAQAKFLVVRAHPRHLAEIGRVAQEEFRRDLQETGPVWIRLMGQLLEYQFRPWRLGATLFTAFGVLALIVATIGVYSIVAYGVSQRTREMGVRLALGGTLSDVVALVLRETSIVLLVGVAIGTAAALYAGKFVGSLLYGIEPRDPGVLAACMAVLLLVGIAASAVPAWRAGSLDPARVLRAD